MDNIFVGYNHCLLSHDFKMFENCLTKKYILFQIITQHSFSKRLNFEI